MFIINGYVGAEETGVWCPLFYCLLPQKTRDEYSQTYRGLAEVKFWFFSSKSYAVYGRWRACSAAWSHSTTWQNTKSQPHASSLQNKSHEIYGIDWNIWLQISSSFFVLFCSSVLCDIMLSSMLIPSWSISRIVSCLSITSRPWATGVSYSYVLWWESSLCKTPHFQWIYGKLNQIYEKLRSV